MPTDTASDRRDAARLRASLPPYLRRTLDRLLTGDSEKQAAAALGLARDSLHNYAKAVYRRFGVDSRAALMARFVAVDAADGPAAGVRAGVA